MNLTNTIIVAVALALIYIFIIKPRKEKKTKVAQSDMKTEQPQTNQVNGSGDTSAVSELGNTKTVVWMAHCLNFPFLPFPQNMEINMEIMSLLDEFENSVRQKDQNAVAIIMNGFQNKVKSKFGPAAQTCSMEVFKFCSLNSDLLNMFKMVIEGKRDENVLSGKGSISRILKYSIELGSPASTLDMLTGYFVDNLWFMNMPKQSEWLKLALECTLVSGNEELGNKILGILGGDINNEEIDELLEHAREFRSQINDSWIHYHKITL